MADSILASTEYNLTEEQRAALRPPVLPGTTELHKRLVAQAQKNWLDYVAREESRVALPDSTKANFFK